MARLNSGKFGIFYAFLSYVNSELESKRIAVRCNLLLLEGWLLSQINCRKYLLGFCIIIVKVARQSLLSLKLLEILYLVKVVLMLYLIKWHNSQLR